jgi:DNA polymerase-4
MRKIVHVDMDAFYVSVEMRDNPSLQGKPVAVGGKSDRRGVLSTCNYIARSFGVSSAMPTAIALQKCPNLIVVPGRMDVYKQTSAIIRQVFERYADKIEPLSLDEAFLDLCDSKLNQGSATLTAQQILSDIYTETALTASAGIAPIKFLAKIASDINKPNGICTISPEQVWDFIADLPLKKIPGVGKVTAEKLKRLNLEKGKDVRASSEAFMVEHFGKYGRVIWQRCHGIDNREIESTRVRKSVGVERTFSHDVSNINELKEILTEKLIPELNQRATRYIEQKAINKVGIKVKFSNFVQTTCESKSSLIDETLLFELLEQAMKRGHGKSARLLGVHVGLRTKQDDQRQLCLALDKKE